MKEDLHIHTRFSTDSGAIMPVSAEAAIKRGIDRIAFTEHWDEDYPEKYRKATRDFNGPDVMALHPDFDDRPLFTFDIDEYFRALEEVRNFCGDRIQILSKLKIRDKLITFLSQCERKYGSRVFDLPFDRESLSTYLGTNRSALSRELSKMMDEGIISFSKNRFEIKKAAY